MPTRSIQEYLSGTPTSTSTNPATYNANFSAIYPNLGPTQEQVSGNTLAHLRGQLSPETLNAIQDSAARFGIRSGIPLGRGGNTVTGNLGRKLVGQSVEGLQSQGLQDYLNTLRTYSGTLMPGTAETVGAETSRYGIDVGANTAANSLAENARQFDISSMLQALQTGGQLGLGYANLGQNYLNSYLGYLK